MNPPRVAGDLRDTELPFTCSWQLVGLRAAEVRVTGELDLATGPVLAEALAAATAAAPLVLLRLEELTFIDGAGLRVLRHAATESRRTGRRLVAAHVRLEVGALLDLLGVRDEFDLVAEQTADPRRVDRLEVVAPPQANPVNAAVLAARVMRVPDRRLWLQTEDGAVRRAWVPSGKERSASPLVQVYVDDRGAVNGWHDLLTGLAVNQRRLEPGRSPLVGTPMVCQGPCGLTWQAPAAQGLIEHGEHCLTCAGSIAPG